MKREIISRSSRQTQKAGEILAKEILRKKTGKTALIVCLDGQLGGGKTTFLQGFAKGLKIKDKVLSPTFIICRKFKIPNRGSRADLKFQYFYHIDCYRIKKPKDMISVGLEKIISEPKNIIALEWAEKIKKILPCGNIWVNFEFINKGARRITIKKS